MSNLVLFKKEIEINRLGRVKKENEFMFFCRNKSLMHVVINKRTEVSDFSSMDLMNLV